MVDWTLEYTISQILIVFTYILIAVTYFQKARKNILITNILAHIFQATSLLLLGGLTGVAMNAVYLSLYVYCIIDDKKNGNKQNYFSLIFFLLMITVLTIFTYDGFGSLLSVFATSISVLSVWQKTTKYYKLLGIPVSALWLGYNIYIKSIFAIILESILFISTIVGYMLEIRREKKKTK